MCSQPIVQDAQLLRRDLAACPATSDSGGCSARRARPRSSRPGSCGWAASLIALNASRLASVPSSRYFAVAGPNDRSRRSRAAASTLARVGGGDLRRGADRDRLEVLRAHHRAQPAAARVPPVVRDRGVPDAALAGRADRRDPPAPAELAPAACASASAAVRPLSPAASRAARRHRR